MHGENVLFLAICSWTAVIMIGIGIFQLKSKKPVGFYTGEQPPGENELTDARSWNKKHGIMWLVYGFTIILSAITGTLLDNCIWSSITVCGGFITPIAGMIWYHHRLIKIYKK